MNFLKAFAASLFPKNRREWWFPDSSPILIAAAFLSGALEFALFGYIEWLQFRKHIACRRRTLRAFQ
jgi:hypothetical protein